MSVLKQIFQESLQDSRGRYSHARIISMLVAIAATVFMWKLIITSAVTIDFFVAYLAYGTGHQTINKFLDAFAVRGQNNMPRSEPRRESRYQSEDYERPSRYEESGRREIYDRENESQGTDSPVAKTPDFEDTPPQTRSRRTQ
jgi:hypothetical protein